MVSSGDTAVVSTPVNYKSSMRSSNLEGGVFWTEVSMPSMRSSNLEGGVFWTEVSMSSMRSSNFGGGELFWAKVSKSFMRSFNSILREGRYSM